MPINLYYPDDWMERVERDLEIALYRQEDEHAWDGFLKGLAQVDKEALAWLVAVAWMNVYDLKNPLEWVYFYPRRPAFQPFRPAYGPCVKCNRVAVLDYEGRCENCLIDEQLGLNQRLED